MHNPAKETQGQNERRLMADPIGTRPTMRPNARVAGDLALFDDEADDSSAERMVIWRWQMRRRRR